MQDQPEDNAALSHARQHLPALAPRDSSSATSTPSVSHERSARTSSGRPPRLSHRSRAGCWTCRGRKVKCDELHPRCGPCTRLNRQCDWDHRWNFSDATSSTKIKHSNVSTAGSSVWDPTARPSRSTSSSPPRNDDLPEFAALTNDEDREKKAEAMRPGTYSVVVTPDSFAELPEYASTIPLRAGRPISRSSNQRVDSPNTIASQYPSRIDPNTIVLDRFEVGVPVAAGPVETPPFRRSSLPETMQNMTISLSPISRSATFPATGSTPLTADNRLVAWFRQYIIFRLIPSAYDPIVSALPTPVSTRDIFELESARFPPLHHAICALSALNLSYAGQVPLEEAINHYDKALSAQTTFSADDMLSDGMFFRHFLLFVYDQSVMVDADNAGAGMWAIHLNHLKRISIQRYARHGAEPHAFLLWLICNLDMRACLMGNGNCDFIHDVIRNKMLPPLGQQLPLLDPAVAHSLWSSEATTFPAILALNQTVVIQTAKLARAAQGFRADIASLTAASPDLFARIHARVMQLQVELLASWSHSYPDFLDVDTSQAGRQLPPRVQAQFEHALTLFHAAVIYSRTSMFPRQRLLPVANSASVTNDTESRVKAIVSIASEVAAAGQFDRRHVAFAVFIAGFATMHPDTKLRCIDLLKAFEGTGIGHNISVVRKLLVVTCEEQRTRALTGGRMEEVDWLRLSRDRGLSMTNCGL